MICAEPCFNNRKSFVRLHERLQYRHSERSRGIPWQKLKVTSRGVSTSLDMTSAYLFLFNNSRTCSIVSGSFCLLSDF